MIERRFLVPKPVDLAAEDGREVARAAALQGLQAMPYMAEIYPVGGARLPLRSMTSCRSSLTGRKITFTESRHYPT